MYKEVKIVMLPSKEGCSYKSGIYINNKGQLRKHNTTDGGKMQHLYITSDDDILNDDDWVYSEKLGITKNSWKGNKVISSTDKSLKLPTLPEDFIKEYIETHNKGLSVTANVEYDEGVVDKDWPATNEYDILTIKIYSYTKESWNKEEVTSLLKQIYTYAFNGGYKEGSGKGRLDCNSRMDWIENNLK